MNKEFLLSRAHLLLILVPIVITVFLWHDVGRHVYEKNRILFNNLANEIERAMLYRMGSYQQVLLGGVGFFAGSDNVSHNEWLRYTLPLELQENFPGINGIGYIANVDIDKIEDFLKKASEDGLSNFEIHPKSQENLFIIKYIEPLSANKQAVGLNIAFEKNRYDAAILARDTGKAAITKRIFLVQDAEKNPGFLLLLPIYNNGMPTDTVERRRLAFNGWIYAPFIGKNFLKGLTISQSLYVDFEVYDGEGISRDTLIYDTDDHWSKGDHTPRLYSIQKTIEVNQQKWTLLWRSTQAFERANYSKEPLFVILGGLFFTGIFAVYLFSLSGKSAAVARLVDMRTMELNDVTNRMRSIVNTVVDGIITIDGKGVIHSFNPSAENIFGYREDEVKGKNINILMPEPYHSEHDGYLRNYLTTGKAKVIGIGREALAMRKDGSVFSIDLGVSVFDVGSDKMFVGSIRDISERKENEEIIKKYASTMEMQNIALQAANEKVERAYEMKSEFLANMSHEIRTPLNGLLGFLDLVTEVNLDAQGASYVEKAQTAGNHLLRIVNDILDLSKIEAGKIVLEDSPFDLRRALGQCLDMFRLDAEKKGISLGLGIEDSCPVALNGDEYRIKQILINLLGNAIKFTKRGFVQVDAVYEDGNLRLTVADSGIGISEEKKSLIFESFVQEDSSVTKQFGGTGLGLTITKKLIDSMSGSISVESQKNFGTKFTVVIPLVSAVLEDQKQTSSVCAADDKYKILLVDDTAMNQDLACTVLENYGHTVQVASNGKEAISIVERMPIDLVLMDIQMPVMGGIEATKYIRDELKFDGGVLPIIALTAQALPDQIKEFYSVGMNAYITKPFKSDQLLQKIHEVMKGDGCNQAEQVGGEGLFSADVLQDTLDVIGINKVHKILKSFIEKSEDAFCFIEQNPGRREEIYNHLHSIYPVTMNLGFEQLFSALKSMMDDVKDMSESDLELRLEKVKGLREKSLDSINVYLKMKDVGSLGVKDDDKS